MKWRRGDAWSHAECRRSCVFGTSAAVAASHPLATSTGIAILQKGGNAVDAAVAVAAVLAVVEPMSTGIGGDCFLLYHEDGVGVHGLNGSGKAPNLLTLDRVLKSSAVDCCGFVDCNSALSVTVPGAVRAWEHALRMWGTMTFEEVLAPAIRIAREGFVVGPITAYLWERGVDKLLLQHPHNNGIDLLVDGGTSPASGQVVYNEKLSSVLERIAEEGSRAFYEGPVAEEIVRVVNDNGGCLCLEDLKSCSAEVVSPISVRYRDVDVYEIPPNGQGITALMALNILEGFELSALEVNSSEYLHYLIEALRLSFADARKFVGDPDVNPVPANALLSKDYAAQRRKLIDRSMAVNVEHGNAFGGSDTVSFSIVDKDGGAVSFVNSLYQCFGSGLVPSGCGFALQNRAANFVVDPGHVNVVGPGKRPYHTIIPAMALRNTQLYAAFNVMGGFMQPQGHVQVVCNLIDHGMDPQAALDTRRFCIGDSYGGGNGAVSLETGIDEKVVEDLFALGHNVVQVHGHARTLFGRGQCIVVQSDCNGRKVLWAGSDGRADGQAQAY